MSGPRYYDRGGHSIDFMTWAGMFEDERRVGFTDLPTGQISYHLPWTAWKDLGGVVTYDKAPPWDGHISADVVDRLTRWQP